MNFPNLNLNKQNNNKSRHDNKSVRGAAPATETTTTKKSTIYFRNTIEYYKLRPDGRNIVPVFHKLN